MSRPCRHRFKCSESTETNSWLSEMLCTYVFCDTWRGCLAQRPPVTDTFVRLSNVVRHPSPTTSQLWVSSGMNTPIYCSEKLESILARQQTELWASWTLWQRADGLYLMVLGWRVVIIAMSKMYFHVSIAAGNLCPHTFKLIMRM